MEHALAHALADVFRCPRCGSTEVGEQDSSLVCGSGDRFRTDLGIPRFVDELPGGMRQVQQVFDFEHRRYRDSWYTRFDRRLVDQFLEHCRLPHDYFAGRRALDAGCGSGRWTYALAELGANVTACDLTSGGLESANAELGHRPNVSFCQANLFELPFRDDAFDFVMSWGVLHHTPDTRAAFDRLVPLVRPGGTLYVMVYERHSPLMFFGTNLLRRLMRRLPDERRYDLCRHLVIRHSAVAAIVSKFLMVSYLDPHSKLDERTLQFGLFDAYSPRYNHLHSRDEVAGWFSESGFRDVVVIDSPRGAVEVRGIKRR